jgi:hypothetical protein
MFPSTSNASTGFLEDYLVGLISETDPRNPFRGMPQEERDQDLIAQGRIGSIPPESVTSGPGSTNPFGSMLNFLGTGGPGIQKVPYADQEYGLFNPGSRYAPPGVTLYGGRNSKFSGPGIKGVMLPEGYGMDTRIEEYVRAPLDRVQLQLRKMGIPGM